MQLAGIILSFFLALSLAKNERKEVTSGYFWHITDMHWDPSYAAGEADGALSCNEGAGESGQWGKWGDFLCDSPWALINSSVYAMKQIHPQPDFLIWTGDDTPHIWDNDVLHKQLVRSIIFNLTDKLEEVWQDTPIFSALGNHDWHPKNELPPNNDEFYDEIADKWQRWLPTPQADETFRKGGYYSSTYGGLSIIVLNTNLYYESNSLTSQMPDPANQLQWFDDQLKAAQENGTKVIVVAHVPPGMFEKHPDKHWFYPYYNQIFLFLLQKHSNTIGSIHMAHHHTDSYRLVKNTEGNVVSSLLLGPAVAPWETTLDGVMGGKGNNPSIRLVEYDKTSGKILDIFQYYLNLRQANELDEDEWELEYQATEYYGVEDFGTEALEYLTASMLDNDELFDKYYKANGVFFDPEEKWTEGYRQVHYCAISEAGYEEYAECMEQFTSGQGRITSGKWAILFVVLISVMIM